MKKTLTYFFLQMKRTARVLPFVLVVTLAICVGLGLVLDHIILDNSSAEDKQKYQIAIVGDTDESYLGFGISALQSIDISKYMVDFIELTEKEARQRLERGKIDAYVIIPEDFIDAIVHGEVKKLTYVTTNSALGITSIFKDEMLNAISVMLVESQNGIYGLQYAMDDYGVHDGFWEHTDAINAEYFKLILSRSLVYEEEIIGISDNLSFGGYMLSGISILLIFLCGITCCPLFVKKDMALPKLLRSSGYPILSQVTGEYLAYALLMFINISVVVLAVFLFSDSAVSLIPELGGMGISRAILFAVSILPVILLITSLQYLLYELSSNLANGVLMQFIVMIALTYIGGCFYPIDFFPDAIRVMSRVLPSGMARQYFSLCLATDNTIGDAIPLVLFAALILIISALIRKARLNKE